MRRAKPPVRAKATAFESYDRSFKRAFERRPRRTACLAMQHSNRTRNYQFPASRAMTSARNSFGDRRQGEKPASVVPAIRRRGLPRDRNSPLAAQGRLRRSPRRRAPERRKRKSSSLKSVSLALDLFLSKSPAPEK